MALERHGPLHRREAKHGQVAEKAYVAMRKKGGAGQRGDQCIVVSGESG